MSLQPGEGIVAFDFGYQPGRATLSNYFWIDADQNGVKDDGENPITGGVVSLFDENGVEAARTQTNDAGYFEFVVPAGKYVVEFVKPVGYEFTTPSIGDNASNSDIDPRTGRSDLITLLPGETVSDGGAGVFEAAPTAITLSAFEAKVEPDGDGEVLVIRWSTSAEFNTSGYHLFRGVKNDFSTARQVTSTLILAEDSAGRGSDYETRFPYDRAIDPPVDDIFFWLSELEYGGGINIYGPAPLVDKVTSANQGNAIYLPVIER